MVAGSGLPAEAVSTSLGALKRLQDQCTVPEEAQRALSTLVEWLGRVEEGDGNDGPQPLDDSSRAYLHSYRDEFTRISLVSRGHGEIVGSSPKVAIRDRDGLRSPQLAAELDKADEWGGFDVFKVRALSRGRPLQTVVLSVLHRFDLVEKLRLPEAKLRSFLKDVEEAYRENPYHNSTHAADVTQGLCAMLACNGFAAALTDLEMLSMVLSCAIHDVGHPGLTNEYLINTGADAAMTYNDRSVNENGHASLGFRLLHRATNNFLEGLPNEQYRFVRDTIINIVLATDMVGHARLTKEFAANARSFGGDLRRWPEDARARALAAVVHACDIGNPAKPLVLSLQWSERIIAENFAQGDREAAQGLCVSPLCDRARVDVPKSQMTFLDYVVLPCFEALRGLAPATAAEAIANIGVARAYWDAQPKRAASVMFTLDDVH